MGIEFIHIPDGLKTTITYIVDLELFPMPFLYPFLVGLKFENFMTYILCSNSSHTKLVLAEKVHFIGLGIEILYLRWPLGLIECLV